MGWLKPGGRFLVTALVQGQSVGSGMRVEVRVEVRGLASHPVSIAHEEGEGQKVTATLPASSFTLGP